MRNRLALLAIAALAACQTVPPRTGFSARQVAALTKANFQQVGDNYELGMDERVLFEVDKSELVHDAAARVDKIAEILKSVDIHGASVEGHTDSTGSAEYNQQLSERRALSVKAEFVQAGMPDGNVRATGKGKTQPVASNDTAEGRQQNRRVVIVVTPADAN